MQKKLIALAIAAAASSAAFAQTNVQIYGIADVGYVGIDADGGKFQHNINSGVLSTSRIGFKGAEDLGNGLKAIFTLEYGLAMDQDAGIGTNGGGLGARQQFVGLTGGFGTVVAGRLQTAGLDYTVAGSALGGSAAVGAVNNVGGGFPLLNSGSRANNAVAYISPSFGGVTVALNHARLTESAAADDLKDNTATLIAVNYDGGPLTAGLVYGKVSVEKRAATGWTLDPVLGVVPPAAAAKANNSDSTEWGVRAGYDFGVAKLQAAYQRAKNETAASDLKNNRWVVSATVPVTAKIGVIGEYAQAKLDRVVGSDIKNKAYTLAGTYSLSKRTTAYAAFVAQRWDGKNNDANIYGVGLRHAF